MALYVLGYWVGIHFYGMVPQFSTVRGAFGKFLAWSFISVTYLQPYHVWYNFKDLSFLFVLEQTP